MSITKEITDVIRELPGITTRELYDYLPHVSKKTITSVVFTQKAKGVIREAGKKQFDTAKGPHSFATYEINPTGTPSAKKRRLKAPTEAGYAAQLEELRAKVRELEAWKVSALERCPDLAVPDVVLKARKLVADEVRACGDTLLADQIIAGKKDETLLVKVAIKALEEAND